MTNPIITELGLPAVPEPLPASVIDAHTHLTSVARLSGLSAADAIAAAVAVGVAGLVDVGCDVESSLEAVVLAETHREVVACVAMHPNDAARAGAGLPTQLSIIGKLITASGRIRGIGETGLDYYRTRTQAGQRLQRDSFAAHIAWARQTGLALVIHDRDAHDDVLDVLNAEGWPDKVVMHCFSGDADHARRCLDHDAWLSFPGTVTFRNSNDLRAALAVTPANRLLVETDAPYLTPMPFRGKPNSSYLLPYTVRFLAEERGVDLVDLCGQLTSNTQTVFGVW